MKNTLRSLLFPGREKRRSRLVRIVFLVCALLVISLLAEFLLVGYYARNWDSVAEEKSERSLDKAEQTFNSIQRETRRTATELVQQRPLVEYLSGRISDRSGLFDQVIKVSREQGLGVEVYDNKGTLVAWDGRSGPTHQREIQIALSGQLISYVTRSQIYSQLFVITPVRLDGRIIGALLVRRTLEVNYPLNNKFISRAGLANQLSEDLGVTVEFNFSENAEPRKDGRYVSATLHGIDSSKVGVVSVMRPARSSYLERVELSFAQVNATLAVLLLLIVVVGLIRRPMLDIRSVFLRSLAVTATLWLARYLLLWLEFPSMVVGGGIFDPMYYASKFGGGLAKSIGELSLTSLCLLTNTLLVTGFLIDGARGRSPWWQPRNGIMRGAAAVGAVTLILLLLRGYAAVIRSAVFDSALRYNDPVVIVPSFELGLMVVNLFVISFCLIVVVVGLTSFILNVVSHLSSTKTRAVVAWSVSCALFLIAAIVFGMVQPNPLSSLPYRLFFCGGILIFTYYLHQRSRHTHQVASLSGFLLALGLSALFFYPLLNNNVHERDRDRVEVFGREMLRPVDSWLTYVVDEALQGFKTEETADLLMHGDDEEVKRLAFTHWAQSLASREGYSCNFTLLDSAGRELSGFLIGAQSLPRSLPDSLDNSRNGQQIVVEEIGTGVNAVKVYSGSTSLYATNGALLATAHVTVAAGQQALFRGESPAVLRSSAQENVESFYLPITLSEFRNDVLFTSNDDVFPIGHRLPEVTHQYFAGSNATSLWVDETIGDRLFETLYVRRLPRSGEIIGLSLPRMTLLWRLFSFAKVLVYYTIVVLVVVIGFFVVQWWRGRRYEITFRDKLLVALVVTAFVPIVIMALYGRLVARERVNENTARQLEREMETVRLALVPRLAQASNLPEGLSHVLSPGQWATGVGTDFNVYIDNQLRMSSRPELYEVEILDRRLSGSAYSNSVIKGKRFFVEKENIGSYQYAVGYRPVVGDEGEVLAIVSVPTLYRLDELNEEVARQNAIIFGIYTVMLFLIMIVATTLANRIAAPIHSLTEATKRVSTGDLNVKVGLPDTNGEIGELVRSFELMTRDLANSREHLVRYEREMAWKEMAKQVAHEIKNPLTPMKLALQHLRQTYLDKVPNFDQVFDEVSKTIIEQIDALSRIATEFSHFARMPNPRLEVCDTNAILTESMHLFEKEAGVRFELYLQQGIDPVKADREELRRAFINIIRNGMQAMNGVGHMTITTRQQGRMVAIRIRDYGPGIPEEIKARLFQPNFSTKTDGMGLGLAIVKKTIDDLNGTITIESIHGDGTTVTIVLPAVQGDVA